MLKKVFKQARGDGCAEVCISVCTPFPRKAPHLIRMALDMILDGYDRLPARVLLPLGSFFAWKDLLCFSDGLLHGHGFSQQVIGVIIDVKEDVMDGR
jgi:hypothetical protein